MNTPPTSLGSLLPNPNLRPLTTKETNSQDTGEIESKKINYFPSLSSAIIQDIVSRLDICDANSFSSTSKVNNQLISKNEIFWTIKIHKAFDIQISSEAKPSIKDLFKRLLPFNTKYKKADLKFLMQQKKPDGSKYDIDEVIDLLMTRYEKCPNSEGLLWCGIAEIGLSCNEVNNQINSKNLVIRTLMFAENLSFKDADVRRLSLDQESLEYAEKGISPSEVEELSKFGDPVWMRFKINTLVKYRTQLKVEDFIGIKDFSSYHAEAVDHLMLKGVYTAKEALEQVKVLGCNPANGVAKGLITCDEAKELSKFDDPVWMEYRIATLVKYRTQLKVEDFIGIKDFSSYHAKAVDTLMSKDGCTAKEALEQVKVLGCDQANGVAKGLITCDEAKELSKFDDPVWMEYKIGTLVKYHTQLKVEDFIGIKDFSSYHAEVVDHLMSKEGCTAKEALEQVKGLGCDQANGVAKGLITFDEAKELSKFDGPVWVKNVIETLVKYRTQLTVEDFVGIEDFSSYHAEVVDHLMLKGYTAREALEQVKVLDCAQANGVAGGLTCDEVKELSKFG